MSNSPGSAASRSPNLDDIGELVMVHLSRRLEDLRILPLKTLDDARTVLDLFFGGIKTCTDAIDTIDEQTEEDIPSATLKRIRESLEWAEFDLHVRPDPTPIEHQFLFGPAVYRGVGGPGYQPPNLDVSYLEFQRSVSVEKFVKNLAQNIEAEEETGRFRLMTPVLEAAIHSTGQMARHATEGETAGLIIFDRYKMRDASGVTVLRGTDMVRFLRRRKQEDLLPLQSWQRIEDCDEYLAIGGAVRHGMVRWIPWTEIQALPIISDRFVRASSLVEFRDWPPELTIPEEVDEACNLILESAKALGERDATMFFTMLRLILKPRASFWLDVDGSDDHLVAERCHQLAGVVIRNILSELSLQVRA